ncbi:MAG: hypothetical protein A3C15_03865 [Candidatus Magasanikbacteria bacterium RIFCSPHIGHO2_02_FULL_50_9b]|uniref:PD(D/E)XK endonuclease domain-containing protein n=1 Tax=Candidatus Magasanikbacteria bacterium RIFCSPHIGHO2_02_FULL_50_9b TaxID=1798682 RepID=A0A1F6M9P8_9BACT|nr:MAG: hypothetical protein A3C15_03865 [Candidatus Magasanikbacteria bacterium RIFCSPHIGHO2_02_FULL_50_9b]
MHKKEKGALGELAVATQLMRMGWRVLFPFGENCRYDLAIERNGIFKRVQVKYSTPKNGTLRINCKSSNNWSVLAYTPDQIDFYAVYNPQSEKVYFISVRDANKSVVSLRVREPKNNQHTKIRFAKNYTEII